MKSRVFAFEARRQSCRKLSSPGAAHSSNHPASAVSLGPGDGADAVKEPEAKEAKDAPAKTEIQVATESKCHTCDLDVAMFNFSANHV